MEPRIATPLLRLQDRLVRILGSQPRQRVEIVQRMLERAPSERVAYWLQLGVSVGIATLGLALGSTAVVIAAMLVAPLMGPIIGLGMGLATGGPYLTLRAAVRVVMSVVVVVLSSALLTLALPFHEINAEIAARTLPTALDLLTAGFCALAGIYAAARPSSDTATTAAGTSIGISLVPPLCAAGFCYGTGQWSIGTGAMLLFLANLVAIVLVGTLGFVALGFNQVHMGELEAADLRADDHGRFVAPVARTLARFYSWHGGSWLRVMMPFVLLALVYVPLRRALDEVTWQVRVRSEATRLLAELDLEIVTSRMRVERHQIDASVVLIGSREDAERTRSVLDAELRRFSGVVPVLEVRAVPDASAAAGVRDVVPLEPIAAQPSPAPFVERIADVHSEIVDAIAARWPADAVGDPLAFDVDLAASDLRITVTHVGPPLDAGGSEVLERSLAEDLDMAVTLIDAALPSNPVLDPGDGSWLARVAGPIARSRRFPDVYVCLAEPAPAPGPLRDVPIDEQVSEARDDGDANPTVAVVRALLDGHPRVTTTVGTTWAVSFSHGGCPSTAPAE